MREKKKELTLKARAEATRLRLDTPQGMAAVKKALQAAAEKGRKLAEARNLNHQSLNAPMTI